MNRVRLMLARILFALISVAIAMRASDRVVSRLGQAFALLLRPLIESRRSRHFGARSARCDPPLV
jgi:hypothetical protein